MNATPDEPTIPRRLQRPLAAVWISLGVHAALIALVQVAPPAAMSLGDPVIEARLVSKHAAPPVVETPLLASAAEAPDDAPEDVPVLVPSEAADALPLNKPEAPPAQAEPSAVSTQPDAASVPPVATTPIPDFTMASSVDLTYYSARDVDVHPRALHEIVPDYPADADRQRLSGMVQLQLKLEADGRVSDITIVRADPPDVFDESAIKSFRDARFSPAQKNGRPVRARVLIEVVYDWEGRSR